MTIEVQDAGDSGGGDATGAAPPPDVDAASLAAAREALGTPAPDTPAAAPEVPAAAPEAAAAPPALTEIEQLRRDVKAKEYEQKIREQYDGQYAKRLDDALAVEREKIREQVRAEERSAVQRRLKENPYAAINELEVDGTDLVKRLAERAQGGPLFDEMAQLKAKLAQLEAKGPSVAEERIKALETQLAQRAEAEAAAARQATEKQLVTMVGEKSPEAVAFFGGGQAIMKRAQEIADEYCAAKQVTTCPYPVVVQQLESEARNGAAEELKKLEARRDALSKLLQQPAGATGKPTEPNGQRASGPRTLSAQGASERRASPKPVTELTAAEADEAMRAAAREAMGPVKKSRMG